MKSMESNPKIDVKNAKAIVEGMGIAKQPKTDVTELEAALAPTENVAVAAE
jgi:hypothetical protein